LAPPTVCAVVKSTKVPEPLFNELVGMVPPAMFAPLMVGALEPKLMFCVWFAVIPPNVLNFPVASIVQDVEFVVPIQHPIIGSLLINRWVFEFARLIARNKSREDVDDIESIPVNVLFAFNNGTFVLNAESATDLEGSVTVPEETLRPLLNVITEENVLDPPIVCVEDKSTYAPPPGNADDGMVPAAIFAPLI
jgi:hypothetical protein